MKKIISMVCDQCKLFMPVDEEKSNKNWTVFKTQCPCGSSKSTPMEHFEGVAPTQEILNNAHKYSTPPEVQEMKEGE